MFFFWTPSGFDVSGYLSFLLVAFFAFAYHEAAHAYVADYLGDSTPRSYGRLTLNPLPHIDRTGFILLALIGFGFATTPINPNQLRGNPRRAYALVAVAGPIANLVMALLFALLFRLVSLFALSEAWLWVNGLLVIGVWLNLLLVVFNLIPIPPLDGFTILLGLLPADLAYRLMFLRRYGMILFLAVFFLLPRIGFDIFGTVLTPILSVALPILLGG